MKDIFPALLFFSVSSANVILADGDISRYAVYLRFDVDAATLMDLNGQQRPRNTTINNYNGLYKAIDYVVQQQEQGPGHPSRSNGLSQSHAADLTSLLQAYVNAKQWGITDELNGFFMEQLEELNGPLQRLVQSWEISALGDCNTLLNVSTTVLVMEKILAEAEKAYDLTRKPLKVSTCVTSTSLLSASSDTAVIAKTSTPSA